MYNVLASILLILPTFTAIWPWNNDFVGLNDMYRVLAMILLILLVFTTFWPWSPRGIGQMTSRGGSFPEGQTQLESAD